MKKVLAILMVLGVMGVFLAGCGSKDDAGAGGTAAPAAGADTTKAPDAGK